ncbi:hypothetical protein ACQ4PT_043166 [Festuca glaucescens]
MAAKLLDGQDFNGNARRRRLPVISGTPHFPIVKPLSIYFKISCCMNLKIVTDDAKRNRKKRAPQKKQMTLWLPRRRQRIMKLQPMHQELLGEMVWEILMRLPVESLARFKLVSKAWQAIISNPLFIRAHLECSKQKQQRNPSSFLVVPQIYLEPNPSITFSTNIRFYSWSLRQDDTRMRSSTIATLHYGRHFPTGEFQLVSQMAHCDGLVLLPTNTNTFSIRPLEMSLLCLRASTTFCSIAPAFQLVLALMLPLANIRSHALSTVLLITIPSQWGWKSSPLMAKMDLGLQH